MYIMILQCSSDITIIIKYAISLYIKSVETFEYYINLPTERYYYVCNKTVQQEHLLLTRIRGYLF